MRYSLAHFRGPTARACRRVAGSDWPFLILVIAIMSILGPGLTNLYIAVGAVGWIPYARITRGETLATQLGNAHHLHARHTRVA